MILFALQSSIFQLSYYRQNNRPRQERERKKTYFHFKTKITHHKRDLKKRIEHEIGEWQKRRREGKKKKDELASLLAKYYDMIMIITIIHNDDDD